MPRIKRVKTNFVNRFFIKSMLNRLNYHFFLKIINKSMANFKLTNDKPYKNLRERNNDNAHCLNAEIVSRLMGCLEKKS